MDLKEQIKKDFGYDLNIGDGCGSADEPLMILDENPLEAAVTEIIFIRNMSVVHGRLWKIKSRDFVKRNGKKLLQTKLDVIEIGETKIVREVINYYFELNTEDIGYLPYIGSIEKSIIPLPYSLGWVNYDKAYENPEGLGTSYEYNNIYLKVGIYVYNLGMKGIPDGFSEILQEHFLETIMDVKNSHPEYDAWGETMSDNDSVIQAFLSEKEISHLFLSAVGGHFIKARVTYPSIPELDELAKETIMHLRILVHHAMTKSE